MKHRCKIRQQWPLYIMALPGVAALIAFSYLPMAGIVLVFKQYNFKQGIFGSPWVEPIYKNYQNWVTDEQKETYENWNEGCVDQKDIGFSFDLTPVSTEYAQLQAVEQEYFNPMTAGIVSYEDGYEEAVKKLKEAGIDAFVEEYQRQFQEFIDSKNK